MIQKGERNERKGVNIEKEEAGMVLTGDVFVHTENPEESVHQFIRMKRVWQVC